jgi:hypothetical protein
MTLLSEASFLVTPNGYKASKLYAAIPTNGNGDMTFTRATTATRVDENDLVSSVASNVPRIDYTGGGCPSILLEPERTNFFTYSEQFDNDDWTKTNCTITANDTTAPDGYTSADRVTVTALAQLLPQSPTLTSGQPFVFSVFVKEGNWGIIRIGNVSSASSGAWFNVTNGTAGTINGGTSEIIDYGNGWYRLIAKFTSFSTGISFIGLSNADGSTTTSAIGTFMYVWGAQLEAGAYPTSYIPTTIESLTRTADVISKTGISDLIGQTEGVLFVETAALNNDLTGNRSISISDGSSINRIVINYNFTSNNIQTVVTVAGVSQTSINHVLADETDFAKIAIRYEDSDVSLWVNKINRGTVNISIPTVLTKLSFDSGAGASSFYGKAKQVQLYKTYLSNDEMAALTTL